MLEVSDARRARCRINTHNSDSGALMSASHAKCEDDPLVDEDDDMQDLLDLEARYATKKRALDMFPAYSTESREKARRSVFRFLYYEFV